MKHEEPIQTSIDIPANDNDSHLVRDLLLAHLKEWLRRVFGYPNAVHTRHWGDTAWHLANPLLLPTACRDHDHHYAAIAALPLFHSDWFSLCSSLQWLSLPRSFIENLPAGNSLSRSSLFPSPLRGTLPSYALFMQLPSDAMWLIRLWNYFRTTNVHWLTEFFSLKT